MNTCTKAKASKEQEISERYVKMLAESMQRTKDMIAKEFFEYAKHRPVGYNEYIHGVRNAIHK